VTRRRDDIQGLRAVAILLVVLYHGGFHVRGGFTGVDVFFAISGFVITGTLLRELDAAGSIDLGAFYARRVRRLLPALATMVAVAMLVGILATPIAALDIASRTGMFASVFGANVYLSYLGSGYFAVSTTLDPLLHTWTLGVEEQFYVVFPTALLVAWIVGRRIGPRCARPLAVITIAAISMASGVLALAFWRGTIGGPHSQEYGFYLSPSRAWEFGAGALVALCAPLLARMPRAAAWIVGVAGAVAVGGGGALTALDASPVRLALPVFGACALLAAGTARPAGVSRLLALPPLPWVGDLSYSWYLWHWPAIVFAKAIWPASGAAAPIAAAVSLVPAWLSFRFVENPIRRRRDILGRRALVVAGACVALGLAASAVLLVAGRTLERTAAARSWSGSQAPHLDQAHHCDSTAPLGERPGVACTWTVAHAKGVVVLLGDSNAGHFSEPVVRAANDLGYDATVATYDGCPYIDLVVRPLGGNGPCRRFYVVTTATLARMHPILVVIAARSDQYVYSYGIGKPGTPLTRRTPERLELWREGLISTLSTLTRRGVPVVVVEPVPLLPVPSGSCAVIRILSGTCVGAIARSDVDAELDPVVREERAAVARIPSATSVDFESALCTLARCSSTRGRVVMYRNSSHLSVDGALTLTSRFRDVIGRAVRRR
jgi:peptidoglycan/LPS O-acetylase OafA/YrhL